MEKKKNYTIRRGLRNAIVRPLNSPRGEQRTLDTPSYVPHNSRTRPPTPCPDTLLPQASDPAKVPTRPTRGQSCCSKNPLQQPRCMLQQKPQDGERLAARVPMHTRPRVHACMTQRHQPALGMCNCLSSATSVGDTGSSTGSTKWKKLLKACPHQKLETAQHAQVPSPGSSAC